MALLGQKLHAIETATDVTNLFSKNGEKIYMSTKKCT